MKRGGYNSGGEAVSSSSGKSKMWEDDHFLDPADAGVDELLAVLGYKVKASDMADVVQKLEHLEEVMGQSDGLSHLGDDAVHYNPSDLSSWLGSMITELDPNPNAMQNGGSCFPTHGSTITTATMFQDDLTSIPGQALYPQQSPSKKARAELTQLQSTQLAQPQLVQPRPVFVVDSQENGVRLVHTLMACAEAVHTENFKLAETLVKQIGFLAVSQPGAMRKVATYFADALARRIYKLYPQNPLDSAFSAILEMHFYEMCPYLKFAHFTANQAILEAFVDKKKVHVIDFGMKQGMQWPALMQALALRPGGPPTFRLTGIGPPSHDGSDHLQEVGWKLAQLAETIHVEFEYRGFVATSLADLEPKILELREGETVAVNSVFELHQLLARNGAVEKVLAAVREMKPEILTIVEQEADHNGPDFMNRFTESLHYYSTLFDSLESSVDSPSSQDKIMSEVFLGKQICNVVACEGVDRVERHETLTQWRNRLESAGFEPVHLGSNAFKQASMLLALFASGDGYRVDENEGCLMLGWHTRPLITTSAWKLK